MARGKGFQGIVGRKPGVTWGSALAAGALNGVEVTNLAPDGETALIEDVQITGRVTQREASPGNRSVAVSLATALRYEGNEPEIAFPMGTAGVPATVDTSGRQHVFKIKDQIDGLFETLAFEIMKDTKVIEVPSVKWNKLSIKGTQGQRIMLELSGIGFDWKDNSGVNTTTTIDTVTLPTNREFALFAQTVLQVNAQSGGSLSGSDAAHITAFEINLERAMEGRVSTQFGDKVDEPIETAFAKVSGSFTFPALQDNSPGGNAAFMAEQMAGTRKKGKLLITSPNLAGASTVFYQHLLWLPNFQWTGKKPGIPGPEGQTWQLGFEAYHVTAIPTGFTAGYIDALTWENFSQRATDALA